MDLKSQKNLKINFFNLTKKIVKMKKSNKKIQIIIMVRVWIYINQLKQHKKLIMTRYLMFQNYRLTLIIKLIN